MGKIFGFIGKVLHFVAKVLAVVAVVGAVIFATWGMAGYAIAFAVMSGLLFATAYGPPIVGKLLSAVGAAARRVTVVGTPPINPRRGTAIGPISSFQQGQDPQIGAAHPDKTTWLGLFVDWVFSRGSKDRQFGPDDPITSEIRQSPAIDPIRRDYCAQIAAGGSRYLDRFTNFKVGWGILGGADGHFRAYYAGFLTTWTRLFVGSFRLTIKGEGDGSALFTIKNVTGLHSALGHLPVVQDVQRGEGPFSNQSQTFWWSEANPCGGK